MAFSQPYRIEAGPFELQAENIDTMFEDLYQQLDKTFILGQPGEITYISLTNTLISLPVDLTTPKYLSNTGGNGFPAWTLVDLASGVTGTLAATHGGTDNAVYVLGDILYANSTTTLTRLAGNTTSTQMFLTQTGAGGLSAAPSWQIVPSIGSLVFWFYKTASDIATYFQMKTPASTGGDQTIVTLNMAAGDTLLASFATLSGVPNVTFVPAGTCTCYVTANRTGGSNVVQLFARFYQRNLAGTETLLATSAYSDLLTAGTDVAYIFQGAIPTAVTFLATDRLVTKIYAHVISGGATHDVELTIEGVTAARSESPSATVDATNFVPYLGATADVNIATRSLFTSTGKIGIGISTPENSLEIVGGGLRVQGEVVAATTGKGIEFRFSALDVGLIQVFNRATSTWLPLALNGEEISLFAQGTNKSITLTPTGSGLVTSTKPIVSTTGYLRAGVVDSSAPIAGDIVANRGGTPGSGVVFFGGSANAHFLFYDGSIFNLTDSITVTGTVTATTLVGALVTTSAITTTSFIRAGIANSSAPIAGDIVANRGGVPGSGAVFFGGSANLHFLYYDGTNFNLVGAPIFNVDGMISFLGITSSFPALKRSTTTLQVRLADDSAYTDLGLAKIVTYNSLATVSGGVPSELATIDTTGLTANVGATTLYAVPASGEGMYRVSAYVVETVAGSVSSTLPNVQVVYTDKDSNTSVTLDVTPILGVAGIGQTGALTANTVGTVASGVVPIFVKLSTTIQYQTVNYASTLAGMTYALRIKLEAM